MNNQKIATFFKTDFPHNKEGLEEFVASFELKTFKKHELILEAGQNENQLRFLEKGVVREYYATTSKETNINFYIKPQFITDFTSLHSRHPTKKFQECLTDIELKILDKSKFDSLLEKYPCGKTIIDQTFKLLLNQKEKAEYNRLVKSPEELYQDILSKQPQWLYEIPQYHIASYLGITPETLSRIRKRIS